jgi:putative hemolysin
MTGQLWLSIAIVLVFILIGGFFAAAEMALISLRESQVRQLSEASKRGAMVARLHRQPARFLAAVQIGVTVAGFLSAAFGASTITKQVTPTLEKWGLSSGVADAVALLGITLVISYFALVLSELAPKRLALQRAEGIALFVAPLVELMARVSGPVIWLLSRSSDLVVRQLGGDPTLARGVINEQELRDLVVGHTALDEEEREILDDVFSLNERQLRELMVPRTEVDFLDASLPVTRAVREVVAQPHSRYPVIRGNADDVVGFVHVRDLLDPALSGRSVRVGELARDVLLLPSTKPALSALTVMRNDGRHLAIVVDEYGGTACIVTLEDLVEEVVGDIRDEYDVEDVPTRNDAGEWELDGLTNLDDFEDEMGWALPDGPYETVAGFVMNELGRVPRLGDWIEVDGHRLDVVAVDGRRASRIRVTPRPDDLPQSI